MPHIPGSNFQQTPQDFQNQGPLFPRQTEQSFDFGGLASSVLGLVPVVGGILGTAAQFIPGLRNDAADGPDPVAQQLRSANRADAEALIAQLQRTPEFSGRTPQEILQTVLTDADLVGKVELDRGDAQRTVPVRFKRDDLAKLTRLGRQGIPSKPALEAFERFIGRDIAVEALAERAGFDIPNRPSVAEQIQRGRTIDFLQPNTKNQKDPRPFDPDKPTQRQRRLIEAGFQFDPSILEEPNPGTLEIPELQALQTMPAPPGPLGRPNPFTQAGGHSVPQVQTTSFLDSVRETIDDVGGVFSSLGGVAGQVAPLLSLFGVGGGGGGGRSQMQLPDALPGGAPVTRFNFQRGGQSVPQIATSANFLNLLPDVPGVDLAPSITGGANIRPVTRATSRFPRTVQFQHTTPSGNSRVITYRNVGSPVVYSGDLATCKRVKKVSRRLRSAAGGR